MAEELNAFYDDTYWNFSCNGSQDIGCLSSQDYIDSITDYVFPHTTEWCLLALNVIVFLIGLGEWCLLAFNVIVFLIGLGKWCLVLVSPIIFFCDIA